MTIQIIEVTDPGAVSKVFEQNRGEMAFDIGANVGQSVERLLPNFTHVIAVEPADESFLVLHDRYKDNDRVETVHAAATDHEGEVVLEVRDIIGTGQLTTGDRGELPWGERQDVRHVPATTVDSLADEYTKPDLLKVDTEGHETLVLQGAERVLSSHPFVIIEIHSQVNGNNCRNILEDAGYTHLRRIDHHYYRSGTWGSLNHYWLVGK